jgi:hypothetical protein
MKTLLHKPIGLLMALIMLMVLFVLPQASQAKVFLSDGSGGGPGGGAEGDPLDSNDYSGGGDDGNVHERRIIPRDSDLVLFDAIASSETLMLRVEFIDDVPVFFIYIISSGQAAAEASHDR